jgi:hypothetical protein
MSRRLRCTDSLTPKIESAKLKNDFAIDPLGEDSVTGEPWFIAAATL